MSFQLDSYINEKKVLIENALFKLLPRVEQEPCELASAMHHAVMGGGKRLRPLLCLAAAEAAGSLAECALYPACGVELLHAYTLVHDDLPCMDNDQWRRGKPTVHVKYGEALAVLAGDALLTLAFEAVARTPDIAPALVVRMVQELASAAGAAGVIAGQVYDTACGKVVDKAYMTRLFKHKTADLFCAAVRLGALAVGADQTTLQALSSYATALGIAFQITDDLLDGNTPEAGNTADSTSCLQIMSVSEARQWAATEIECALTALQRIPGPVAPLAAIVSSLLDRKQ